MSDYESDSDEPYFKTLLDDLPVKKILKNTNVSLKMSVSEFLSIPVASFALDEYAKDIFLARTHLNMIAKPWSCSYGPDGSVERSRKFTFNQNII